MHALTESQLAEIEARVQAATPGPWKSMWEGRDHQSGDHFIMRGTDDARYDDLFLSPGRIEDQDFVAHARQDVPALLAEVRRLREFLISHGESWGWMGSE